MSAIPNAIAFWRPALTQDAASYFAYYSSYDEVSMFIRSAIITAGTFFVGVNRRSPGISIFLAPLIGRAYFFFEQWRATTALNQLAIDLFMKNDPVPQRVIHYLSQNPLAVSYLLTQPNVDLNKISESSSETLLERALREISTPSRYLKEKSQEALSTCKLLIDKGADVTKNFFLQAIEHCPALVIYVLEKDKIKVEDFTNVEQFNCWIHVKDNHVAELLTKKGFNINIDNEGTTPLLHAAKSDKIKLMCLLINNKASLPACIIEKPKTSAILTQARKYQENKPSVLTDSGREPFALWRPAIWIDQKLNVFQVDGGNIMQHIFFVSGMAYTLFCYIAISLKFMVKHALPPVFLAVGAIAWLSYKYAWSKATSALNDLAMQEFQTMLPKALVTKHISQNESAMDQLLANGADLNKMNNEGETLWDLACESSRFEFFGPPFSTKFSIFKKLADRLFNTDLPIDKKHAYFLGAVKSGYSKYVEYLLETGKINFQELTETQQVECWASLRDRETVALFLKYGCNVNAVNDKGFTPLLQILSLHSFSYTSDPEFTKHYLTKTLIGAGANLDVTVEVEQKNKDDNLIKVKKGVFDFVQDSGSKSILVLLQKAKNSIV